jgi:hypothetical protein
MRVVERHVVDWSRGLTGISDRTILPCSKQFPLSSIISPFLSHKALYFFATAGDTEVTQSSHESIDLKFGSTSDINAATNYNGALWITESPKLSQHILVLHTLAGGMSSV